MMARRSQGPTSRWWSRLLEMGNIGGEERPIESRMENKLAGDEDGQNR
jgi:hypothetical protein